MPKFEKGSEEAKEYMRQLRLKRIANKTKSDTVTPKPKRPRKTKPKVDANIITNIKAKKFNKLGDDEKEKLNKYLKTAIDKYFEAGSAVVEVPPNAVTIDKNGDPKIIPTLTKAGNIKKVKTGKSKQPQPVIKLEINDKIEDLQIKSVGKKIKKVSSNAIEVGHFDMEYKKFAKFQNTMFDIQKQIITLETKLKRLKNKDAISKTQNELEKLRDDFVIEYETYKKMLKSIEDLKKKIVKKMKNIDHHAVIANDHLANSQLPKNAVYLRKLIYDEFATAIDHIKKGEEIIYNPNRYK